jgi:hypothetical protein
MYNLVMRVLAGTCRLGINTRGGDSVDSETVLTVACSGCACVIGRKGGAGPTVKDTIHVEQEPQWYALY